MGNKMWEVKVYKKNQVIFRRGDTADCMYDILWGSVGIYTDYGTDEERLLTTLEAGEIFGEMGLVDDAPRSATAVSLVKGTQLEVITADSFDVYLQEKPAKVMRAIQHMSHRVRELTKDYLDACRAVSETVRCAECGEEKSEWFQKSSGRFVADFERSKANDER